MSSFPDICVAWCQKCAKAVMSFPYPQYKKYGAVQTSFMPYLAVNTQYIWGKLSELTVLDIPKVYLWCRKWMKSVNVVN